MTHDKRLGDMDNLDPRKLVCLMAEINEVFSSREQRSEAGLAIFRQLLIYHPEFMKIYKPLQNLTLPQALNSEYLKQLAVRYVDNILDIVENINNHEVLNQKIVSLANVHKNRGITVAHMLSVLPQFTDSIVAYLKVTENKESMQQILSTVLPMIGKRL